MEQGEFVARAKRVVEALGIASKSVIGDGLYYADEMIEIRTNYNGLALQVTRMENRNPTTMVAIDGDIIRHHGEAGYLDDHLNALASGVASAQQTIAASEAAGQAHPENVRAILRGHVNDLVEGRTEANAVEFEAAFGTIIAYLARKPEEAK